MNKREFVMAASGSLMAGTAWAAGSDCFTPTPTPTPSDGRQAAWQRRVGDSFEVFGNGAPTTLVLQQVDALRGDAQTEQFSLVFAASGQALVNGTHVLRHTANGPLALYLADTGLAESGATMLRADFCLLA